jgi:hypothetical protein
MSKVWGIGLGRTGTKSLCEAWRVLGYEKVIHNPLTLEELDTCDAAAEALCAQNFKYLDVRFPDSKFVLTFRNEEDWLESCARAMERYPAERLRNTPYNGPMIRNRMVRFGCIEYDEPALRRTYHHHHLDVLEYFNGRRNLLRFDVMKGEWADLCRFLGKDVPATAFPNVD